MKGDLWDDEPQSGAGDLANLAAAALNFRSSMNEMKGQDAEELEGKKDNKDAMETLIEQTTFAESKNTSTNNDLEQLTINTLDSGVVLSTQNNKLEVRSLKALLLNSEL